MMVMMMMVVVVAMVAMMLMILVALVITPRMIAATMVHLRLLGGRFGRRRRLRGTRQRAQQKGEA